MQLPFLWAMPRPFYLFSTDFVRLLKDSGILSFHFSNSEPSLPKEVEKKYIQDNLILVKKV